MQWTAEVRSRGFMMLRRTRRLSWFGSTEIAMVLGPIDQCRTGTLTSMQRIDLERISKRAHMPDVRALARSALQSIHHSPGLIDQFRRHQMSMGPPSYATSMMRAQHSWVV